MSKTLKALVILLFLLSSASVCAQVKFQMYAGFGYIEHLSVGAGCTFSKKHAVALLYGSDLFIQPKKNSAWLLQYQYNMHPLKFAKIIPAIGIKGGHTTYTDHYYTWQVAVVIPFVALQYPVNEKVCLVVQGGSAFSFEQSVKRISYGDIGHYRDILPEVKAGIVYSFVKSK